jgi:hypothetical protein
VKAAPGRPVLTLIHPDDVPDHRHGPSWWWFRVREAKDTARWHILTAVAAVVARVVPRVRGQAWREGFDTGLCRPSSPTWRQHLDDWHEGNQLAHEIVYRRHGQAWDGAKFSLRRPLLVPDPAGLAAVAADVVAEDLVYSGAARAQAAAEPGGRWRVLARVGPAVAVMAAAALDARCQRVAELAPLVATRPAVAAQGRHATPRRAG